MEESNKSQYRGLTPYKPGESGSVKMYNSPEQLQAGIENYFVEQDKQKRPYTVTGLARSLGFTSRLALLNYEKAPGYEMFHEIVTKAKLIIEERYEEALSTKQSVAGPIFCLKNMGTGWKDTHTIEAGNQPQEMDYSHLSLEEKEQLHSLLKKAAK